MGDGGTVQTFQEGTLPKPTKISERKNGGKTKTGGTVETLQEGTVQTFPKQPIMTDCDFVVFKYVNLADSDLKILKLETKSLEENEDGRICSDNQVRNSSNTFKPAIKT